jgi:NAD+ synthase
MKFNQNSLVIDCDATANIISTFIAEQVKALKRDGIVIGMSGGVDSSLCAHLCVKAVGPQKVTGLILPERESSPISLEYAKAECANAGIQYEITDVSGTIESLGGYSLRNETIKRYFPDFNTGFKSKITLPGKLLDRDSFNFYTLVIEDTNGNTRSARIDNQALREIVAATNSKQRTRMLYLYRFAEINNFLVCGTTNRTESVQGFFVKYGDGGVDIEPIAQLYKSQVYQLSEFLKVTKQVIDRAPTPDTFSLGVTDEEFYFRVPYEKLDLLLYAWENKVPVDEVSVALGLSDAQVKRVFRDINAKYNLTTHLRSMPPVPSLETDTGTGG